MVNFYDAIHTEEGTAMIEEFNSMYVKLSAKEKGDFSKYAEEVEREREKMITPEIDERIRQNKWK